MQLSCRMDPVHDSRLFKQAIADQYSCPAIRGGDRGFITTISIVINQRFTWATPLDFLTIPSIEQERAPYLRHVHFENGILSRSLRNDCFVRHRLTSALLNRHTDVLRKFPDHQWMAIAILEPMGRHSRMSSRAIDSLDPFRTNLYWAIHFQL